MGDDPLLRIEWEMHVNDVFSDSGSFGEPESYVACYEGRIFLVDDEEEHVGLVKAHRCLLGDASPFMVLVR